MWWMDLIEFIDMRGGVFMKKTCMFVCDYFYPSILDEVVAVFGAVIEVSDMAGRGVWKYKL